MYCKSQIKLKVIHNLYIKTIFYVLLQNVTLFPNRAMRVYYYIYILLLSLLPTALLSQEAGEKVRVYGKISDAATDAPLPYTSVRVRNTTNGCSSDNNGNFSFYTSLQDTLIISSIGYKEERIPLSKNTKLPLNISMKAIDYTLSEVTIKPKKEKYSRKNNPAVTLVKEIIGHKDRNDIKNKTFYSRKRHEILNLALNNFKITEKPKKSGNKFKFLEEYIDTSLISGKPILNVSAREIIATDYFRQDPERERKHIIARRRNGIDDIFTTAEIDGLFEEVFKDVDIYQDNITIFRSKFVSPLSKLGTNFYRYYIMDTVAIEGEEYIDLTFAPFNAESFGFTGHMYVATDSSHFIKAVDMTVPSDINMNFVEYMNIKQSFNRLDDGTRLLDNEKLICEFKIINAANGFYANRNVSYTDYNFESNDKANEILKSPTAVVEDENSMKRSKEFWSENRIMAVSEKEQSVGSMMERLRANPFYYWTEKCVSFLFTGWVPLRKNDPPAFYGPVNTTFSYNGLEGLRLRAGAMTSAYLNPHLFGRFYVAYGVKDNKWKYMGELEYSFKKKKEHANEFPIHSLRLGYTHDIFQYGQNYLYTNKDNFVLSLKRGDDNKIGYVRKAELTYTHELHNHFSYKLTLRNRIDIESRFIKFEQTKTIDGTTTSTFVPDLKQSEVELALRYAPGEKFLQSKWNRISLLPEKPVFTLSHKVGFKGILGSKFYYHHTEARFEKRFWFSAFGHTDCIIKAGKVWNKVPYPLLIIPNTNLSYTIQKESYWLMNPMEFFTDQYASWDISYHMNGLLFNRIPLIRKLNWREVITCRGMFGHLSEKNRPDPLNTGDLFKLPYTDNEYGNHYLKSDIPYIEASVGIENIFKVLRVDYVRRFTYTDLPGISKWGIRIQFHVQF